MTLDRSTNEPRNRRVGLTWNGTARLVTACIRHHGARALPVSPSSYVNLVPRRASRTPPTGAGPGSAALGWRIEPRERHVAHSGVLSGCPPVTSASQGLTAATPTIDVRMTSARRAFTLFEIAIALALLAVSVVSVFFVFTQGIKAQQMARFRIFASAMTLTIVEQYAHASHGSLKCQIDAERLARAHVGYDECALEHALVRSGGNYGLMPLPNALSRRIDSNGDEIARLLDDGGKLFYCSPRPPVVAKQFFWQAGGGGGEIANAIDTIAPENQRLVVGIVGYPQQKALRSHPCIDWPLWEFNPAPPIRMWPSYNAELQFWTANAWPALGLVEEVHAKALYSPPSGADGLAAVQELLALCQSLVAACGIATSATVGGEVPVLPQPYSAFSSPWPANDPDLFPPPYRVMAMRWLAYAAHLRTGDNLPAATAVEEQYAVDCVEASMEWAHRYACADPYDWGAPRVSQSMTAFDAPLLQFDAFAASPIVADDGGGRVDRSWPVLTPKPVTSYGSAWSQYSRKGQTPDNRAQIDASWGDPSHYALLDRFDPADRCREIIIWSVDWLAYEDAETVPSEPFDARLSSWDTLGNWVNNMGHMNNPERDWVWQSASRDASGYDSSNSDDIVRWSSADSAPVIMGRFGADRNGNGRLDSGPIPTSARMRAEVAARFPYYDKCLIANIRF